MISFDGKDQKEKKKSQMMETYTPWRDGNYFIIIMYARDLIESSHERLGILLFNLWETRNREILIKNWHMKSASTVKLKFLLHFLGHGDDDGCFKNFIVQNFI